MKVKVLLYTTKAKPTLYNVLGKFITTKYMGKDFKQDGLTHPELNGKIVAECDYEIEEITYAPNPSEFDRCYFSSKEWCYDFQEKYGGLSNKELLKHSCLTNDELSDYLNTPTNDKKVFCKDTFGYAIHIKNLHIFDKPRELNECYTNRIYTKIENVYTDEIQSNGNEWVRPVKKAPQNMMKVWVYENGEWVMYILISIQSQWMCKILNKEKDVEVRKVVLKEMLRHE